MAHEIAGAAGKKKSSATPYIWPLRPYMLEIADNRSCRRLRLRDALCSRLRRGGIVDLNRLYFDHQLLLMKARDARSSVRRLEFQIEASDVAGRISRSQRRLGAAAAPQWQLLAGAQ